jgi:hypothetical protein
MPNELDAVAVEPLSLVDDEQSRAVGEDVEQRI